MAAKKKSSKKVVGKAKLVGTARAAVKPKVASAKKTAKKAVTKAQGLLGKLAQKSAQLILDSGLLGEAPKSAPTKKSKSKSKRKS